MISYKHTETYINNKHNINNIGHRWIILVGLKMESYYGEGSAITYAPIKSMKRLSESKV